MHFRFIWIMGVSITLSFRSLRRRKTSKLKVAYKIIKRSIILFGLGLFTSNCKHEQNKNHLFKLSHIQPKRKSLELCPHISVIRRAPSELEPGCGTGFLESPNNSPSPVNSLFIDCVDLLVQYVQYLP